MSKHKFFPIKTQTACALKWGWSSVFMNDGTTSSCHRVGRHPISLDNFDNFHNTPEKIDQRNTMLRGEWPQPLPYMSLEEGCRYCQKIEEAGGQSDRMFHMQVPDMTPKELDDEPWATTVTPTILEVYFNNTCNLSCTYCNAQLSSKIENEQVKFGDFIKNGVRLVSPGIDRTLTDQYIEKFFSWLERNSGELKRLQILGGEPLYQKEFYRCLDFFETHPNRELEFNFITNLMLAPEKFQTLIDRMKTMTVGRAVKRFDITISLDCWGEEQEYARYGLKLDTIQKNIEYLLDKPWIYININSTLTPLTIRGFHKLVDLINSWKKSRKMNHHFQTVFSPGYHNPDIFGPNFWDEDFALALSKMPQHEWQEVNAYKYLSGIHAQIQNGCKKPEMIVDLHTHLDELDRRRGTNWKKLFPYLDIK